MCQDRPEQRGCRGCPGPGPRAQAPDAKNRSDDRSPKRRSFELARIHHQAIFGVAIFSQAIFSQAIRSLAIRSQAIRRQTIRVAPRSPAELLGGAPGAPLFSRNIVTTHRPYLPECFRGSALLHPPATESHKRRSPTYPNRWFGSGRCRRETPDRCS